jgi:hypothetical protein
VGLPLSQLTFFLVITPADGDTVHTVHNAFFARNVREEER